MISGVPCSSETWANEICQNQLKINLAESALAKNCSSFVLHDPYTAMYTGTLSRATLPELGEAHFFSGEGKGKGGMKKEGGRRR
jgi:hypothetical protein